MTGTGNAKTLDSGMLRVDPKVVEAAEAAIAGMVGDYEKWARNDLAQLSEAFDKLRATPKDEGSRRAVFKIAHDMKGHGASFGYDLVTLVGDSLCRFIEKPYDLDPGKLKVIAMHIDVLRVIFQEKMRGHGGGVGARIVKGLQTLAAKYP